MAKHINILARHHRTSAFTRLRNRSRLSHSSGRRWWYRAI